MNLKRILTLVAVLVIGLGLQFDTLNIHPVLASSLDFQSSPIVDLNHGAVQAAADEVSWSMAGANPQRTSWVPEGVNPDASSNFGVVWYRPIEAYIGQHVQLITARDKVYVSTARGLYALDTATGNEVWRFNTEMPLGHSPTVLGNTIYVGGFDKRVYALNADTGSLIWTFTGAKGGFSTSPLVIEDKVLLGSRDGYFYALNKNTGALQWQFPASNQKPLGPILYSAAYKAGKVFFAANDNYAYSLNASNGSLSWRSEKMPGDGYQAWWPVIYGNYVIFSSTPSYSAETDPGGKSVADVVNPGDPYYNQMNQFQYGHDPINTIQRDDVFYQGAPADASLGPEFAAGGPEDTTGIAWSWPNGAIVVDASRVTQYLENDGQAKVNRPTQKPWRRGLVVLDIANGSEFTLDSDQDGYREYAPFLFTGSEPGNRYPPLVIPTRNANGGINDVLYAQNFNRYKSGWGISRASLAAWQFGTQYIFSMGSSFAIDEPVANSAGGSILYENLCCDRVGSWTNMENGSNGSFWNYGKTLESIKLDENEIEPWMKSIAPGYDQMWWGASMWRGLPRLLGNYGTMNGIYHNHGLQNPIIPYKGRLFVHRSNAIIALGPNSVSLSQRNQNETPEQYEQRIRQQYPQIARPLLPVQSPSRNTGPVLTVQDLQKNLDNQITGMLQKGHLQPGYFSGTRGYQELYNYFENPGDTLYTLVQAYPYVSEGLKPDLEKYIKQHYKRYFENDMYARTGYWIDNPGNYNLNNVDDFGQLQPRGWMLLPAEVATDIQGHNASKNAGSGWPWKYPQHNIYAMWKFADTFYRNDQAGLVTIYNKAKSALDSPPDESTLRDKPWIHNAYISGYMGFLRLQELAGQSVNDASLRASLETELNKLLALRSNDFRKDYPWSGDWSQEDSVYRRGFNVARNFMYLTPELGTYLHDNAFDKVKAAVDEYERVAPYWVAARYEASFGESSSDNLYTHPAMFQAKAYILKESTGQLLKYVDAPAFETGDLFYIQNLVAILENYYGISLKVFPLFAAIDTGGSAAFTIEVLPTGGFTETVTISVSSPSPQLRVGLASDKITPPGQTSFTLTDLHPSGSLSSPLRYTVPVKATYGDIVRTTFVNLLVNGYKTRLPIVSHPGS